MTFPFIIGDGVEHHGRCGSVVGRTRNLTIDTVESITVKFDDNGEIETFDESCFNDIELV